MRDFCMVIWILLSEVAAEASDIRVSGHVGGSVKIQCSHLFARTNTKYFCRDPCEKDQHILIKSGRSPTGRYTLKDSGKGDFTVTITCLQKSDAGTYWCGVDRLVKDTYHKVLLTVTDALTPRKTIQKVIPTAVRFDESSSSPSTSSRFTPNLTTPTPQSLNISSLPTGVLLYAAAGLGGLSLLIFVFIAHFACKRTVNRSQGPGLYTVYAEVKGVQSEVNQPNRSSSSSSSSTESHEETLENPLYSTVDLKERLDLNIYSAAY
ncbi:CMRF35-like molecule 3 isoform X2 [Pygocentrus nattereri]|uniref:CMRF35-like molecule 3 isoform X2 n=1 Tax=Pygocentrus nattereri TaxID=42514 RepID=UPI001891AD43|nr:CMRF35-like molecule 3 isoform X2 [Pygocentrus nattereri]